MWQGSKTKIMAEKSATLAVSCHGFRYFAKERLPKNARVTFQISDNKGLKNNAPRTYPGRVAWSRKSRRPDRLYLVGIEFAIPLNIWDVEDAPADWVAFSTSKKEESADSFLTEVHQLLRAAQTKSHYQLLGVQPGVSRSELKRCFYQLARKFHPDHHMDQPEWTPRLVALMEGLTAAYRTLSDDESKKEYDLLLTLQPGEQISESRQQTQVYLNKAQECMTEKNFAGCILWLHRAIESEPDSSSHRALLGKCLSAVPEYRREAVEQFEMAIQLDPRNIAAHYHYGELLEQLHAPWRARPYYLRVLELDANHWGARERLGRLGAGMPRASSKSSLLGRLRGRR